MKNFFFSNLLLGWMFCLQAYARPIALVYDGPGSCSGVGILSCTGAAEAAAQSAGYQVVRVKPDAMASSSTETDYQAIFGKASVWMQPGGGSRTFLTTATPELKFAIRRFVNDGGGYVGFCAGAFSATEFDGSTMVPGLNLFPGKTEPYVNETIDFFLMRSPQTSTAMLTTITFIRSIGLERKNMYILKKARDFC